MKKLFIICNILIMLLLFGCSGKQQLGSELNSSCAPNESEVISGEEEQSEKPTTSSSEAKPKLEPPTSETVGLSQETLDFLNGVYPDGKPPKTIYEVTVPTEEIGRGGDIGFNYLKQNEQYIEDSFGTDIIYCEASDKSSMLTNDNTVVSGNNVAYMLYSVPFRDVAMNGAFNLSFAEAQLNVDIKCARDTGIKVIPESEFTRMYSAIKCDAGGYVYVFFDSVNGGDFSTLKSIIYINKIYSYDEVSFIKEGTPISEVFDFSPTLKYCYEKQTSLYKDIIIPLTDGVMVLKADISETKTILSANYYPDSIVPNPSEFAQSEDRAYNFTILPQDYPPAE